jgi:two-component system response regulator YesN
MKILLVDSDGKFRRLIRETILRHYRNIQVEEAPNRTVALQHLIEFRPELILTEIDMQGHRSLDLLRRMRQASPESAIAVLTSYDQKEYQRSTLRSGAHYFISKVQANSKIIRNVIDSELARTIPNSD